MPRMTKPPTASIITEYFRAKRREILAAGQLAVVEHAGLRGTHRELVVDRYLREILPGRFDIGHGQIHGAFHRSREADVVLWDSLNFPRMSLLGSTIFFSESVRTSIEVKSRWNAEELQDILVKTRSVRDVISTSGTNLDDELALIRLGMESLATGEPSPGLMSVPHHIGTAAFVVRGGQEFRLTDLSADAVRDADDAWPDLMLMLEAGVVVVKDYLSEVGFSQGSGRLERFELGEDSLLFFTHELLSRLVARSVYVETPLDLSRYQVDVLRSRPIESVGFKLTRPNPGRSRL